MSDTSRNAGRNRLGALDAFRGATIAAMLLVNNPGSWSHVYGPLRHAPWHGWTPTDLIFPYFLFVVGVTTHLAIERRIASGSEPRELVGKVFKRGLVVVLLGLALNAFPFVSLGQLPGLEDPNVSERVVRQFQTLRIPGVLQRIGIVYLLLGSWVLLRSKGKAGRIRNRLDALFCAAILLGYWALLTVVPVPGSGLRGSVVLDTPGETIAAWSDRAVFGVRHLWAQSKTWDPEGALSTLPALATALIGLMVGRWLVSERSIRTRLRGIVVTGVLMTALGLAWGLVFPINKNLWTSSYVVFSAGAAALGLALCVWLVDVRKLERPAAPLVAFGVNPMLAFFGSGIMARLLTSVLRVEVEGRRVPVQRVIYESGFASWLPDYVASLAYALCFVLVWLGILWPLWKREIIWKV